jgi:hypothetical protein
MRDMWGGRVHVGWYWWGISFNSFVCCSEIYELYSVVMLIVLYGDEFLGHAIILYWISRK